MSTLRVLTHAFGAARWSSAISSRIRIPPVPPTRHARPCPIWPSHESQRASAGTAISSRRASGRHRVTCIASRRVPAPKDCQRDPHTCSAIPENRERSSSSIVCSPFDRLAMASDVVCGAFLDPAKCLSGRGILLDETKIASLSQTSARAPWVCGALRLCGERSLLVAVTPSTRQARCCFRRCRKTTVRGRPTPARSHKRNIHPRATPRNSQADPSIEQESQSSENARLPLYTLSYGPRTYGLSLLTPDH